MGVGILAKRVVLELSSSTNFVYSLRQPARCGLSHRRSSGLNIPRFTAGYLYYLDFFMHRVYR